MILGEVPDPVESQEILLALADMAIGIFALESVLLRARKVYPEAADEKKKRLGAIGRVTTFERTSRFYLAASRCAAYARKGDSFKRLRQEIVRLSDYPAEGLLDAKQLLAEESIQSGRYFF